MLVKDQPALANNVQASAPGCGQRLERENPKVYHMATTEQTRCLEALLGSKEDSGCKAWKQQRDANHKWDRGEASGWTEGRRATAGSSLGAPASIGRLQV